MVLLSAARSAWCTAVVFDVMEDIDFAFLV